MNKLSAILDCFLASRLLHASIFLPLIAYLLSIWVNKIYLRRIVNENRRISYIRLLVVPIGLAMFIPYSTWMLGILPEEHWAAALFQALRYVLHTFAIEDTLGAIQERAADAGYVINLTRCEDGFYSFLMLLAPFSTATFLLSFFKTPQFWARIHCTCRGRKAQVYFFSDLNERAVSYANSLLQKSMNAHRKGPKPIMVFCMDEEKPETGDIDAVNVPGAVILRSSICSLPLMKIGSNMRRIHFYLVTNDENRKLNQAQRLLDKYHGTGCHIRCISAQQTNDHEIDYLNKRYKFWDSTDLSQIGQEKPCRILIQNTLGDLMLPASVNPWLVITCGSPKRSFDLRRGVIQLKAPLYKNRFLMRTAKWRCVAFVLRSSDNSRMYHEAQLLYKRSQGHKHGAFICCPGEDKPPTKPAPTHLAPHSPTTPAPDHSVLFNHKGSPADAANMTESQSIRSNFIDLLEEASNLAYVHLHHQPLMTDAFLNAFYKEHATLDECKPMRVLVLGSGAIGEELARICLWYCQLPGMRAEVTVADQEDPKLILGKIMKDHMDIPPQTAESYYAIDSAQNARLFVRGKINFRSKDLEALLNTSEEEGKGYHAIFVCSGDDDLNYRLALRLRRFYLRKEPAWGCPMISVNIWSDSMNELLHTSEPLNGLDLMEGSDFNPYNLAHPNTQDRFNETCRISIFGTMHESMLQDDALHFDALRYHAHYCGVSSDALCPDSPDAPLTIPLAEYHSYYGGTESDRRSNMAAAIHGVCKYSWYENARAQQLLSACKETPDANVPDYRQHFSAAMRALGETEHRRWCIFKLLEGSSRIPEDRMYPLFDFSRSKGIKTRDPDNIRGYHAIIRPWQQVLQLTDAACCETIPDIENPLALAVKWQDIERGNYLLSEFCISLERYKVARKQETDKERNAAS